MTRTHLTGAALGALVFASPFLNGASHELASPAVSGELKQWHRVTLNFEGPSTSEKADPNPFSDLRLDVEFTHVGSGEKRIVPGFYAADGDASESGAESGSTWRVHFLPEKTGRWTFAASLVEGDDIAIAESPGGFDSGRGEIEIIASDKSGRDLRSSQRGLVSHQGGRYLTFAGSGKPFIKGGPGAPENILGYHEFDGTYDTGSHGPDHGKAGNLFLHKFEPHVGDWKEGDPTWRDGKGKGIIGALNYVAAKGMRSLYFITHTIDGGDGKDVWPWIDHETRDRFDCSKLDQWEILFTHMDQIGVAMHFIFQETENDQALEGGDLGRTRKLYFREMIARFGHHPAVIWNLGEENTNTTAQLMDYSRYIKSLDAYGHPIAIHTFPGQQDKVYGPLLGKDVIDITSQQIHLPRQVHDETIKWLEKSAEAGEQWVVPLDEIGPANRGVDPDGRTENNNQQRIRHLVIWGNMMAGGSGVEHYFGYKNPHSDMNCEDWRSRDKMWDFTRHAIEFFEGDFLPLTEMAAADALTSDVDDYCLAKRGEAYAIYLPYGGGTVLDLSDAEGRFTVEWYDPRNGGGLKVNPKKRSVEGGGFRYIGQAPNNHDDDWVALVRKQAPPKAASLPTVGKGSRIHVESNGLVVAEAEDFYAQTKDSIRKWYWVGSGEEVETPTPDPDPDHSGGAGGAAYLEILPDTRTTHDDPLIHGENFTPEPNQIGVLSYAIEVTTPGRYYVWVRAYSTGTEDNGIHVGINGQWPESGKRLQWSEGKNSWRWESKQRTKKVHSGVPGQIFLDIEKPGRHTIQFSMREDGFEFDRFLLTRDPDFDRPEGVGPDVASHVQQ